MLTSHPENHNPRTNHNLDFYLNLPLIASFAESTLTKNHADLPPDWWVVIADVEGSTKAIEQGAYKKVNTVGVACIAAVVNVDLSIEIPFVFGGDGATFAIPDSLRERVEIALRGAQQLAQKSFGLSLRVGLVRVADLITADYWVKIGKFELSPYVTQAVFSGRGWEEAERRVKTSDALGVIRLQLNEGFAEANFEGFECRWQGVPSFNDHKLSLLVCATNVSAEANLDTYKGVLDKIHTVYGEVVHYHPLQARALQLTFNPLLLAHEWRVRTSQFAFIRRISYLTKMLFQNIAGKILFARNMDTEATQWTKYRDELVDNSDFRKFDGMLRMVMDGTEVQADKLQRYLQAENALGNLAFGMHKSREALVTCIVRSFTGNHMHFVDGSDGGYALAARGLKAQLKNLKSN